MPERLEMTLTPSMSDLTQRFMAELSMVTGRLTAAAFAESARRARATWIEITTTRPDSREG